MTPIETLGEIIWIGFEIAAACAAVFAIYLVCAITADSIRHYRDRKARRDALRRRPPYDWKTSGKYR